MTHKYIISGMTCEGCVNKVKSALLKVPHVLSADVQIEAPQATITMDEHVIIPVLQTAIGKYIIKEDTARHASPAAAMADESVSYYPIFLIFGMITGITLLIQATHGSFQLMEWMSQFMAGFFLLFSFFKLLNIKAFAEGYSTYDIIAAKVPAYGLVYPFIELALGIAFLTGFQPMLTNAVTLVVMGVSTIGVIRSLARGTQFQCACLGTIIKLPLSKVTLFEDLLMVAMSLIMLLMLGGAI